MSEIPIKKSDVFNKIIGDRLIVRSLDECKELCEKFGFSRRDKVKISSTTIYRPDHTSVNSVHRHKFAFVWAEKSEDTGMTAIYGMPRSIGRQMVDVVWIYCVSQQWVLRVTIGMQTNKVLEVYHSQNGRPFTGDWDQFFSYVFRENDFDASVHEKPDRLFFTSDGYLYREPKGLQLTRPLVKDLKTYKNFKEYEKLMGL